MQITLILMSIKRMLISTSRSSLKILRETLDGRTILTYTTVVWVTILTLPSTICPAELTQTTLKSTIVSSRSLRILSKTCSITITTQMRTPMSQISLCTKTRARREPKATTRKGKGKRTQMTALINLTNLESLWTTTVTSFSLSTSRVKI